jgi:RimJ/RimL family protein N-acetyltransferase
MQTAHSLQLTEKNRSADVQEWNARRDDILFRPFAPEDAGQILRLYNELSPKSRSMRFFGRTRNVSRRDLPSTRIDRKAHFVWVAIAGERCVAVARWLRITPKSSEAEMAITVHDDYQGRGIGGAMLRLLMRSAVEQGVRRLTACVLAKNEPVIRILTPFASEVGRLRWDVLLFAIQLPDTPTSIDAPMPRSTSGDPRSPRGS